MKSELEIIFEGCKCHDPVSQSNLVRRFAPVLLTVARRFMRDIPSSEDVLQDAFVLVFKYFDQLEHANAMESWMRRIVINVALKDLKKSHNKTIYTEEQFFPDNEINPEIFSKFGFEDILNMISKLPNGYREIFNLNVIDGYSHENIGELLGINPSTSRSQLSRARKFLQLEIEKMQNELERI